MTNPNAFVSPSTHQNSDGTHDFNINKGLTKREYFAAIMLQGLVTLSSHQQSHESHATQAIAYADALINALNKTK
jgi:hypothetical protein